MKRDLLCPKRERKIRCLKPKLFVFLLVFTVGGLMPVQAHASEQQRVTLQMKNATGQQVLERIREVSRYRVSYVDNDLNLIPRRDYSFANSQIDEVMDVVVEGTPLIWKEQNGVIVISRGETSTAVRAGIVTVTGTIKDRQNIPVAGATVLVKGGTKGVTADAQGRYSIEVPRGTVLIYSFIGYVQQEITVGNLSVINVVLETSSFGIEEVVVRTGYQEIARNKMTGATATVTDEELSMRYSPNLLNNLEGRVAGLVVYGDKAVIRGISSLKAETSPLLVVDGIPFEGTLEDINPFDVKNVTVLKDAAATAIYGARASNGIIVVTTKSAAPWKEGGRNIHIDVNANVTVYQKKNVDYADNFYLTPEQQVQKEMEWADYYFNGGVIADPVGSIATSIDNGNYLGPVMYSHYLHAKGELTDAKLAEEMARLKKNNFAKEYAKHVLRNRVLQEYNVAVRSSGQKFQSNLVMKFRTDNEGYIKAHDDRFSIFYKGTYNVSDWMRVNFSVNTNLDSSNRTNSERVGNDDPANPFNVPAYFRLLNDDGSYADYTSSDYNIYNTQPEDDINLNSVRFNHLKEMGYDRTKTSRQMSRYHANIFFRIFRGLSAETQFTYENERYEESTYSEADSYVMRFMKNVYTTRSGEEGKYTYKKLLPENGGKLKTLNRNGRHYTARGQLNYSGVFNRHAVDVIAGLEFRQTRDWGYRNLFLGYDDQLQTQATTSVSFTELYGLNQTSFFKPKYSARNYIYNYMIEPNIGLLGDEMHRYASGYFNATYVYDGRYNAFASFRKDYTDVFGLEAKYRGKPLWSVGVAWNAHREAFLNDVAALNYLKVRLTYGKTGNIYHGATSYMTATTKNNNRYTKQPMSVIETAANPWLKWEETGTLNAGIDFAFFENRLTGSFDWYRKNTTDLFSEVPIESTKGYSFLPLNSANMLNNGYELTVSYDWIDSKKSGFYWNSSLTVAYNKNEITKVIQNAKTPSELAKSGLMQGYPINSLFSAPFAGINDEGRPTWHKVNGETDTFLKAEDLDGMVYSGHSDPSTSVGFSNYIYFRGFSLNLVMVYYGGHHLRAQQAYTITQGLPYRPLASYWQNSWTPENKDTNVPGFGQYAGTSNAGETEYTDIYVRTGDFLKIRNIVVGYDVPQRLASKMGMKKLALSFQVNDPKALWLKNSIKIDPETGGLRVPTSYVFGLSMNF